MIDKKVFHEFLGEVKGVEKQKKEIWKGSKDKQRRKRTIPILGRSIYAAYSSIFCDFYVYLYDMYKIYLFIIIIKLVKW